MSCLLQLVDDPIFIPILQLEMDKKGHPAEFAQVVKEMQLGKTGHLRIEKARSGRGKVGMNQCILPNRTAICFMYVYLNCHVCNRMKR